jgi:hypothetical protein
VGSLLSSSGQSKLAISSTAGLRGRSIEGGATVGLSILWILGKVMVDEDVIEYEY